MESTISDVADFIKRYKDVAIIRFTLGKYTTEFKSFEKHLFQEENYFNIMKLLESNPNWDDRNEEILNKNNVVSYKIIDSIIYLVENGPYDIFITAESKKNQEIYISDDYIKKIIRYKRKTHVFELGHENNISNGNIYNFSLIFKKNSYNDTYNSHSSILKIEDILKSVDREKPEYYTFKKL